MDPSSEKRPAELNQESPSPADRSGNADEIECRCKEASRKSLSGLLKMMLRDLQFWKK